MTKVKVLSEVLKVSLASMLVAVEAEAKSREDAITSVTAAAGSAWATCRDAFLPVLAKDAEEGAALLEALKTACKEAKEGREFMGRGIQYATDLKRAYKLVKKGHALPEALKAATRPEWLEHEAWKEAGVLSKAGRPGKPEAGKPEGEGEEGEGDTVSKAVKPDAALSSLMQVVGQLRGPFRAEFMKEAEMLAVSILAKQASASGSGSAAASVTSKPEAKAKGKRKAA